MTATLLDFSRRRELALHASIVAAVEAAAAPLGIATLIAGAFARDLHLILRNYLHAGNEHRLWDDFLDWTQEDDFRYEIAGAQMLGHDVRALLDEESIYRIVGVLSEQADSNIPARLPSEMDAHEPDGARALLDAMLGGVLENWRK